MKKSDSTEGPAASELIDQKITELGGWRGRTLGRMRQLIHEADPAKLFNSSLDGNMRRAIDLQAGEVSRSGRGLWHCAQGRTCQCIGFAIAVARYPLKAHLVE